MKVVCIFGEKTSTHAGWLKAEVLAERHIYSAFSSATREILLNARLTRGPPPAKPIFFIQGQYDRNRLFGHFCLLHRLKEKRKKDRITLSLKGSVKCCGEMPDEFTTHFSYRTVATSLRPSWKVLSDKKQTSPRFTPDSHHHRARFLALWWLSTPFLPLVLLQPFNGGFLHFSGIGGDIFSVCFNALHSAVTFVTLCQINSGFALSSLRGPIEDHFRCF